MNRCLLSIFLMAILLVPPGMSPHTPSVQAANGQAAPQADPPKPRLTITNLGALGGSSSLAYAISNTGKVVGSSDLFNGDRLAFLWTNGVMQDLGSLGERTSDAFDVYDAGQVA